MPAERSSEEELDRQRIIRIISLSIKLGLGFIAAIFLISSIGNLYENLDANEIMVLQAVPSGELSVFTTPGWKWQGYGKITKYHKRGQFEFELPKNTKEEDHSMRLRFNDGGHANASGSFAYEMPTSNEAILTLHMKYGTQQAVEQQLIRPSAERAIYFSGPLMSSTESYASRRSDLLNYIEDQMQRGLYRTDRHDIKIKDAITGEEKTATVVDIAEKNGVPLRQEASPLGQFGIRTFNLSLNEIRYEEGVEKQIQTQQQMQMAVQTAIAEAKKAEQQRITTEQNGMAAAAKAKWDQEVIKAKEVTAAQQRLAVAELDAKAAEQDKRAMILRGEGEGASRRAKIAGDNALDQRLQAWIAVNKAYAEAMSGQPWVPSVQMGGTGTGGIQNGRELLELMAVKAAKDLSLDMSMAPKK